MSSSGSFYEFLHPFSKPFFETSRLGFEKDFLENCFSLEGMVAPAIQEELKL